MGFERKRFEQARNRSELDDTPRHNGRAGHNQYPGN